MFRVAIPTIFFTSPAFADTERYGHMMDWGYGYGFGMMFGPILWLIVLGLIVVGVIWFVRRIDHGPQTSRASDALSELDLRLARGEIDIDDYAARKKLLEG
ncbi:hypothetical protein [Aestuariicoccus sp. MJ-SS9]|uniref:SHOCT domain-containing protein n=1 Tax=Aestuariicoccus sp. MJ-SS9 TaxID=3079855 RepID=UPI00290E7B84|nr:hypothetical protein [Aestuariicoccus sp. MJ-SS9]MDU8914194.1 hypothetical protein [Aestuariicoccus sp. MJ-SS9]